MDPAGDSIDVSFEGCAPNLVHQRIELDFYVIVDRVNQLTRKLEYLEEIEVLFTQLVWYRVEHSRTSTFFHPSL